MADKTVVVRIILRANQFSGQLQQAANDVNGFAIDVARGAEKAASSSLALGAASATAGKLMILGIGGAMAVSAKVAIEFESSMAGVAKTTDLAGSSFDAASGPLYDFAQALRSVALRVPINVNELARIAELGGQLGIQVPNLVEFTEVIAEMGVSTNLASEEAAMGLARFANIMGTSQDDFRRLGSVIVELGNNLASTESEILNFALRIAPVGATVGMTEEEVFGLAGALTSLGIPAERGGTAIQRMMIRIASAVKSGGEGLDKFARAAGMTSDAFADLFRRSPAEAFAAFVKGLDQITRSGGNAFGVLRELGITEQRTVQVLLASAAGWESVANSIEMANEEGKKATALEIEAARRFGTTASQIQLLGNAWNDLSIEIGNAILGSGGLAGAIDALREFFTIVRNNLPTIQKLGVAVVGLTFGRLAVNIAQSAAAAATAIASFKMTATSLSGVEKAAMGTKVALSLLNVATLAAVGVGALLFAAWFAQAQKAAALRTEVRGLAEDIKEGTDPVKGMIGLLTSKDLFGPSQAEAIDRLGLRLGFTRDQFIEAAMAGRDLVQEITGLSDIQLQIMRRPGATSSLLTSLGFGDIIGAQEDLRTYYYLLDDVRERSDALLSLRKSELRTAFIETGNAAGLTYEEIDNLTDQAIKLMGLDVSDSSFLAFMNQMLEGTAGRSSGIRKGFRQILGDVQEFKRHWTSILADREEGELVDAFFENLKGAVDDYHVFISDRFAQIEETIFGQFPVWDEYEQVVIESVDAIIAAQDAYVADTLLALDFGNQLEASGNAMMTKWYNGLDTAHQAAVARLAEKAPAEYAKLVEAVTGNLTTLTDTLGSVWKDELPEAARQGLETLMSVLVTQVNELGISGEHAGVAFKDGLAAIMSTLTPQDQEMLVTYLSRMVASAGPSFFEEGNAIGNALIQGLIAALMGMSAAVLPVIHNEAAGVINGMKNGFGVTSPSKFTIEIGKDVTRGFFVGLDDEWNRQMSQARPMFSPAVNQFYSGGAASHNRSSTYHLENNFYNPQSTDIVQDAKKAELILTNVVHLTEAMAV